MRASFILLAVALFATAQPFSSAGDSTLLALAPDSLRAAFRDALADAGQNWTELAAAVAACPAERRAEAVWLVNSMPHLDRLEMTSRVLLEHIEYAHLAMTAFEYHAPDSLFRDFLLTYRLSDEPVTAWRKLLHSRFAPVVQKAKTPADAARIVNRWLAESIGVVKRGFFGPMKSPELVLSSRAGTKEETAVLAAAILKSLGIPSRRVKVPWLGAEDNDASWLEIESEDKWLPCYPLEPDAFGDFGWLEREHKDNVTIAVATSAFDQRLVTSSYTSGAQVRVRLSASGLPLPTFESFAFSVFNAGAWRPLDELNTVTDSTGGFECFLGNGHYQFVSGQRDPRGDPWVVTREFDVAPDKAVEMNVDLTAPATEVPGIARTPDFTRVLPNVAGGVSSATPTKGKPGLVLKFDPSLPVARSLLVAVQQLFEKYEKEGFFVQGLALGEPAAARAFAEQNGLTFPIACAPRPKGNALEALNPENYGAVILYDATGAVVYRKARPRTGDLRELNHKLVTLVN